MSKLYTKSEVDYSMGLPEAHCSLCEHYRIDKCEIVAGKIEPDHWCEKFDKKLRNVIAGAVKGDNDSTGY